MFAILAKIKIFLASMRLTYCPAKGTFSPVARFKFSDHLFVIGEIKLKFFRTIEFFQVKLSSEK